MTLRDLIASGVTHALTLHPEHAAGVRDLDKRVENRRRPFQAGRLGQRIAIHAGALHRGYSVLIRGLATMAGHARGAGWSVADLGGGTCLAFTKGDRVVKISTLRIVSSAIVATAVVRRTLAPTAHPTEPWHLPGEHGWILEDVEILDTPIPAAPGQLGLWTLEPLTRAA